MSLSIPIVIDSHNQWWSTLDTAFNRVKAPVLFKIDTGSNHIILSHTALKDFKFNTGVKALVSYPKVKAQIANGGAADFRHIGNLSLYYGKEKVCDAPVLCHATKQTHDLLGTSTFLPYKIVSFNKATLKLSLT